MYGGGHPTTHWKLKEEYNWVPLEKLRKEKNIKGE